VVTQSTYTAEFVVLPVAPIAGFTSNSPIVLGALAVFSNTTTGTGAATYEWDFGDGSSVVTDTNPTHQYAAANTYSVVLTATNLGGSSVYTDTFQVQSPTGVSLSGFSGESRSNQWIWLLGLVLVVGLFGFALSKRRLLKQVI
jgi:PKD repeat protein